MSDQLNPSNLVAALLTLQFAVFGLRISREIAIGDLHKRTWLLFSDYLNFAALIAVVACCIIYPLHIGTFGKLSRTVLAGGYALVCMMPLVIAGHYRLFSRQGRDIYLEHGEAYPWMTGEEMVLAAAAILVTAAVVLFMSF